MTRMNSGLRAVLAVALALALSGCVSRAGDLTFVTTKNIDLTKVSLDPKKGQRFKGEDCRFVLLGIIPFGLPNIETAIDRALEAGKGNVMVDEVTSIKETYFIVGGQTCAIAEGTVLNTQAK